MSPCRQPSLFPYVSLLACMYVDDNKCNDGDYIIGTLGDTVTVATHGRRSTPKFQNQKNNCLCKFGIGGGLGTIEPQDLTAPPVISACTSEQLIFGDQIWVTRPSSLRDFYRPRDAGLAVSGGSGGLLPTLLCGR